jgi:hypothetical protein
VAGEPLAAAAVANADTHIAAYVVFAVASDENTMNAAFFAQITHLYLLRRYDRVEAHLTCGTK